MTLRLHRDSGVAAQLCDRPIRIVAPVGMRPRGNLHVVEFPPPACRDWWPPRRWFAPEPLVRLRVRFALQDSGRDYIVARELDVSATDKAKFIDADNDRILAQQTFATAKTAPLNDGSPEEFELVIDLEAADIPKHVGFAFLHRDGVCARVVPSGHPSDGPVPGDPVQLTAEIVAKLDGQPVNVDALGVRIAGHVALQALAPRTDSFGPTALRVSVTLPAPVTNFGEVLTPHKSVKLQPDLGVVGPHSRRDEYRSTLQVFFIDAANGRTFPYVPESVTPMPASASSSPSGFKVVLKAPYLFPPERAAIEFRLVHSGGELTTLGSVQPAGWP